MAVRFRARAARARAPRFFLAFAALSLSIAVTSNAATVRLAAGGGMRAPLTSEQRENFDSETIYLVSVAGPVSSGDVWVYAEMGYGTAKGDPYESDPTFNTGRTRYRWTPLSIGFRANAVPPERRKELALYLGVGGLMSTVTVDPPYAGKESSSTVGFVFEFRPELNLKNGWGFWARDRVALLSGNEFNSSSAPDINLTSNGFELGISRRFGKPEEASR